MILKAETKTEIKSNEMQTKDFKKTKKQKITETFTHFPFNKIQFKSKVFNKNET